VPLTLAVARRLRRQFRICLCSPELEGHPEPMIRQVQRQTRGLPIAAVCTDHPDLWGA